jgi:hypothetical protein
MTSNLEKLEKELGDVTQGLIKEQPLILVFHSAMKDMGEDVFRVFVDNVQRVIRDYNILAFFMPTELGNERVECINPVMYQEGDLKKLYDTIEKIDNMFNTKDESLNDESVQSAS